MANKRSRTTSNIVGRYGSSVASSHAGLHAYSVSLFAARDKSKMNGNGNGRKVRATETWPDAGAMERVGVVGNVHWRFGVRRMSAVGCRRSVGRGQCFWCRFGQLSKKFHSFLQYFLNPLYCLSANAQLVLPQTARQRGGCYPQIRAAGAGWPP